MILPSNTSQLLKFPLCDSDPKSCGLYVEQGLIQSVFELLDGSGVVVTVGKYVTPNHRDINGNGIEPDYRNLPGITLSYFCNKC